MHNIYLDHAATTPMHPEVIKNMGNYMAETFGNPSSVHHYGRKARHLLDQAREVVATSIHAKENEIIFTSGGTEADNLAILGAALANKQKGRHIVTTSVEHHAVLHTCEFLQKQGFEITFLPVDKQGKVNVELLQQVVKEDTILVSIMYGNNEVGTIQPVKEIGHFLQEKGVLFHTDAVQAYGVTPIDVNELHVDLLSASSHKINGPKGIGFLYVKTGVKLSPLFYGGEQERKRRAGTENLPAILGFKDAISLMLENIDERREQYKQLKQKMIDVFTQEKIPFDVNSAENGLPHILNVSFPGINVESMLVNLDLAGVCASSGSACTAGSIEPSHVLVAMFGNDSEKVHSSIRFSFGMGNSIEQIETAALEITKIVKRLVR